MDEKARAQFLKGIRLFNREEFYDCHDTIEEIWLEESSDQQPFLQGIIQAAVAFHHYQHGKRGAARSMLQLAIDKLTGYSAVHGTVDLHSLKSELERWKKALDQSIADSSTAEIPLAFPKIQLISPGKSVE